MMLGITKCWQLSCCQCLAALDRSQTTKNPVLNMFKFFKDIKRMGYWFHKKNKIKNLHKLNKPIYLMGKGGGKWPGANFRKEIGTISEPYRFWRVSAERDFRICGGIQALRVYRNCLWQRCTKQGFRGWKSMKRHNKCWGLPRCN